MKTTPVNMTISDYCAAFERNEIRIDTTYQRSPEVWPLPARSYLIETILKGLPIPKLALHQVTDLKSKQTIKYVIDGQQRSAALKAFYDNDLRLSRSLEMSEAAGRKYEDLPEELQEAFLTYMLDFDQFEAATDEDVREYFRRINSFTAPLNPEEQRHAQFQGPMKWFIQGLRERYGEALLNLGVLQKRSIIRMADAKLLAELMHALKYGITTTSKTTLNAMYREFDKGDEIDGSETIHKAFDSAMNQIVDWPNLQGTALMKTHVFYSLLLAVILVTSNWEKLKYLSEFEGSVSPGAEANLRLLAAALDEPEIYAEYSEFVEASEERTNVKAQREMRVSWLVKAITATQL